MTRDDAELLVNWLLRQYPPSERPAMPTLAHSDDDQRRNGDSHSDPKVRSTSTASISNPNGERSRISARIANAAIITMRCGAGP
jgi:hypothetical protein